MAYHGSQAERGDMVFATEGERKPNTKMGSQGAAEPTGHPFKHALKFLMFSPLSFHHITLNTPKDICSGY
jgi:hypothetical protein